MGLAFVCRVASLRVVKLVNIRRLGLIAMTVGLSMLAGIGGCAALVGDECEVQTDCGRVLYCERSLPGGYCTKRNCVTDACPDEGVCVVFESEVSFCMLRCDTDDDCRDDGYACVKDFGPHAFCNDIRGQ